MKTKPTYFDPIDDAFDEARKMTSLLQSTPSGERDDEKVLQALLCCERAIGGLRLAAETLIDTDEFIERVAYTVWGVVHVGHLEDCTVGARDKASCPYQGDHPAEAMMFVERQLGKVEQATGLTLAGFLAHVLATTPEPFRSEQSLTQILSAFAQYLGELFTCAELDEEQDRMFGDVLRRLTIPSVAPGALVELYAIAALLCEQGQQGKALTANPTLN